MLFVHVTCLNFEMHSWPVKDYMLTKHSNLITDKIWFWFKFWYKYLNNTVNDMLISNFPNFKTKLHVYKFNAYLYRLNFSESKTSGMNNWIVKMLWHLANKLAIRVYITKYLMFAVFLVGNLSWRLEWKLQWNSQYLIL